MTRLRTAVRPTSPPNAVFVRNAVVTQATGEDGEGTPVGLFTSFLQHSFFIWGSQGRESFMSGGETDFLSADSGLPAGAGALTGAC